VSPIIGVGRFKVKQRLEALRDADMRAPREERQYRTIGQAHFRQLCEEAGGIVSPEHFLGYLHNAGTVFYRPGLFGDAIVLDQAWALEAIYAVFHRESCYPLLLEARGRFTRKLLKALVWRDYEPGEQHVFLGMMVSCGICFVHRKTSRDGADDEVYIAPELLPERSEAQAELDEMWDADAPSEVIEFDFPFLHQGLVRAVISHIGSEAGATALYWKGGLCVYEKDTRSRALIEQNMLDDWHGRLLLRTQRGKAAELLRRLASVIQQEASRMGLKSAPVVALRGMPPLSVAAIDPIDAREKQNVETLPPATFGIEPSTRPRYYVSYSWNDETPEGRDREAKVDEFCAAAEAAGVRILRDKNAIGVGDSITRFMEEMSGGDRVFVFLSPRYLTSYYSTSELYEIWRIQGSSGARKDDFIKRIRTWLLPDTPAFGPVERIKCAIYWNEHYEELEALSQGRPGLMGRGDFDRYKRMQAFVLEIGEILELVTDRVQPASWEDFLHHGLDDLEPEH
jgi:internalin A